MTDEDLRAMLTSLRDDIKTELTTVTNTNLAAFESIQKTLGLHGNHIHRLWKQVRGSDPPANGSEPPFSPDRPPLDEMAEEAHKLSSQNDLELAALESRMAAGFQKVTTDLATVRGINENQTKAMGLREDGRVSLSSHAKSIALVIAAITGLVTASAEGCAIATGRTGFLQHTPKVIAP